MKIKSGPIQTVLAFLVAIGVTYGCMKLFGVFVGHETFRAAIRDSKGTVVFSMAIGVASYLATIWVTSLNKKELEDLEVRASISEDIASAIASLRAIQLTVKENALEAKILSVTKYVVNAVSLSVAALSDTIQANEISKAVQLHELASKFEIALKSFVLNSKQADFDPEAAINAEEFRKNAPLMLVGFVNLMKEIQNNNGSLTTATKEIMALLGGWGYVGELDKITLRKEGK